MDFNAMSCVEYCGTASANEDTGGQFYVATTVASTSVAVAETKNDCKSLMQMNGRKVLGPPEDWVGPAPSSICELFVRRIPKDVDEQKLIQQFFRFGRIFEIRLPMDFNQESRGYCYVKYTNEEDASCAMEVLVHYFVAAKRKLEILHSYEKCRLFVSNIPKSVPEKEVENKMRFLFPTLEKIYTRNFSDNTNASNSDNLNRGYVILQFPTHIHALEAKKCTTPGLVRVWGRDLKIVWAYEERENNCSKSLKTLFLRNVELSVNKRDLYEIISKFVPRSEVSKVTKNRTAAFVDFITRDSAEICYRQLQGYIVHGRRLDVEWAKPSEEQSLHNMRNTDFDATLRLKCLANNWQIPIVLFGTHYENEGFQYCGVMLRSDIGIARAVFCILQPSQLVDIHSRLCEVACVLLETIGEFNDYNYVFYIDKDDAHLLGMVTHNIETVNFIAAHHVPTNFILDLNEIIDLSSAFALLSALPESNLLQTYFHSLQMNCPNSFLAEPVVLGYRCFGTIHPKYRNKPALKYNLNDTQIILALCYVSTGSNSSMSARNFMPVTASTYDKGFDGLRYITLKLLPTALIQSRYGVDHILSHVKFGGNDYYHPSQRWQYGSSYVAGCSYTTSIKHPTALFCYMPNCSGECNCAVFGEIQQQQQIDQLPQQQYDYQQQPQQYVYQQPQQQYDYQPQLQQYGYQQPQQQCEQLQHVDMLQQQQLQYVDVQQQQQEEQHYVDMPQEQQQNDALQ